MGYCIRGAFATSRSLASTRSYFPDKICRTIKPPEHRSGLVLSAIENDDAAALLAGIEIGEGTRRLVDRIGTRDQLVEFQSSAAIQADQPRKIQLWACGSIHAAGQGLLAGSHLLSAEADLIFGVRDAHDYRRASATQDSPRHLGDLARTHAVECIVGAAAGELVQILAGIGLSRDIEDVRGAELFRELKLVVCGIDRDDHARSRDGAALNGV